jgi:hypothetical protein
METDSLHQPGQDKEWNESFYFNFYDREQDICAFMRIGLKPNMNERSMFCFLMMPDGSLVGIKDQEGMGEGSLFVRSLRFEKVEAEKKWKLSFNGSMARMHGSSKEPVAVLFALEFDTLNNTFDYRECVSGENERISQKVASEHLEQYGRATGTLMVGGETFEVNGLGERDHSWGVRDWNAPKMWIWLTAEFDEQVAFNLTKLFIEEAEVSAGFVHEGGRNIPLIKATVNATVDADGRPRALDLIMGDKDGNEYRASAEVLKAAQMPFPSRDGKTISVMHETLAEYTYRGMKGYGIAEFLVRGNRSQ